MLGKPDVHMQKIETRLLSLHKSKMNQRPKNYKGSEAMNLLEENIGEILKDIRIQRDFFGPDLKNTGNKSKKKKEEDK
jgi:hypothetical protein